MTRSTSYRSVSLGLLLATGLVIAEAQLSQAEVTDRHRQVAQEVFDRLLAVQERPKGWDIWPPTLTVVDNGEVNAFAYYNQEERGRVPTVGINRGTIEKVAKFDRDVLAFTLGHELGHLVHLHSAKTIERHKTYGDLGATTAMMAVGREQEIEADLFGMQIALKAGFSHQGIRKNLLGMMSPEVGSPYCAFEGLELGHPSWEARASYLQRDKTKKMLWQSMVAFRNGVLFLETEGYLHAEFCFRRVVSEFPDCYEGWANLGYALLMQYCDALDEEDLRAFDIGHLVVGGFYRRPDSLATKIRGIDENLWYEAVGAFREAIRLKERLDLKEELLLVKANLAVAYLIHPAGKQVGEAEKYFQEVFQALQQPENANAFEPIVRAAIWINSGAGRGLDEKRLKKTLGELKKAAKQGVGKGSLQVMHAALDYSQARRLAVSTNVTSQNAAFQMFESYLAAMSPASSWWPLAYAEYKNLAEQLKKTPKATEEFRNPGVRDWRSVSSVTLADGKLIGLAQSCETTLQTLGKPDVAVPVIPGTNLKRHYYKDLGISILGSREVLAVFLESAKAPPLTLTRPGLGGTTQEISVGMSRKVFEGLLGGEWDSQFASIDNPETVYHLYRSAGIAVQFDGDMVKELVVVVVPRKS